LSFDFKVVSKIKGVKFVPIATGRLQRKLSWSTIPSLLKIPHGFCQSLFHLIKLKPNIIASFGGYISVPVILSGWLLRIPSITHEQTRTIGLANRINSFFAKKVAVSFSELLNKLPKNKSVYTGMLLRACLKNKKSPGILADIDCLSQKTKKAIVFVTGGKSGSRFINNLVKNILPALLKKHIVVHQTGSLEFLEFKQLRQRFANRYWSFDLLKGEEWGWILNNADIVVSRAGANIVSELIFLKKPSILIPIPWSYKNEQDKNAELIKELRGGEILNQKTVTPQKLLITIEKMIKNKKNYIKNLKQAKITDGKERLLLEIEKLLR